MVEGWGSTIFALAIVFASIVMYDASGIRRAAGMHAQLINDLVQELAHLFDEGFQPRALKTLLGHTYPQVVVGADRRHRDRARQKSGQRSPAWAPSRAPSARSSAVDGRYFAARTRRASGPR
jgi:hypothetical protein